ncbi:MAG: hypothetical protein J3R72DRAFT_179243 [Linnemannia gamsii]|nr:MAG: hypothetical protein J3R72DRAFT_179243 [Linnemannia gamsii]
MLSSPRLTMSLQPISSLTFGFWSYIIFNLGGGNMSSTKVSLGLFDKNPGQRRLKIGIKMEPKALFSLVTEHVQDLQDLDIEAPWRGDVKALIDNLPECLRTVRLKDGTHQAPWEGITPIIDSSASSATMRRPLQHHALESLHIDGNLEGHKEQILVPFLEGCSQNLKSIIGPKLAFLSLSSQNARISHVLSNMCVIWTHLHRDCLPYTEEPIVI